MLEKINHIMGTATPFAVLLAGLLFAFLLRGLPFSRPVQCAKALRGNKGEASSLKGLALALAGTLGVGNIVGVASAIALGGPGAIFWMWVSAVAAMFLKYAEVVLGVKFRESLSDGTHRGGAPFYIRAILSKRFSPGVGRGAAVFFALLCLANAFTMGCVIQSNAVGSAITNAFGFSPLSVGLFLALISLPLLFRGHRAVSAATSLLVPLMSGVFLLLSIAALYLRYDAIPAAFAAIFKGAFSLRGAAGGAVGFTFVRALRFGTVRGLVSNEAGCGTSPTAHAATNAKSPTEQGLLGIVEVFVDTILICTVTALVVIIHWNEVSHLSADPMRLAMAAYTAAFPEGAAEGISLLLALSVFLFGFATILCWAHYGREALSFVLYAIPRKNKGGADRGQTPILIYNLCFCLATAVGAVSAPTLIWALTDLVTESMTLLNTAVLLLSRRLVLRETQDYFRLTTSRRP